MTRALICAAGAMLRSRQRPDGRFDLEVLTYGRRPIVWRTVDELEVHGAAAEWARERGITVPEADACE